MATTICTVCGCKILEGPTVGCPRCDTPHHAECWDYNGGCGIFACNPNTKAVVVAKPGMAPSTNSRAILLVGIAVGLLGMRAYQKFNPPTPPPVTVREVTTAVAPGQGEAPWVGYKAPDFAIRDLDGKVQKFSEIRKGRTAILSFWLAHCSDCMPHVPAWAEVYKRYKENDQLVLVNVAAFANDPASTKAFAQQYGIGGRILMDGQNQAVSTYQLGTITSFVIDRDGVIRYREGQAGTNIERVAPVVERVLASGR
jgi:peroxiredoxin